MDYFYGYKIFILNIPLSNGQITLGFGELDEVGNSLWSITHKTGITLYVPFPKHSPCVTGISITSKWICT